IGSDGKLVALCSGGELWTGPESASLEKIAAQWALMVAAMMAPLLVAPLRHVHDRSFARRRARAMLMFVAGYAAMWMMAGVALQVLAFGLGQATFTSLLGLGVAAALAIGWQVSPAKQWCLNRCHRRPQLAAFGAAADRDAVAFGLANGASCAGACWALMLLPLLVGHGNVLAMIAVALFVLGERLEAPAPPAWRWRGTGKAVRIIPAQARVAPL